MIARNGGLRCVRWLGAPIAGAAGVLASCSGTPSVSHTADPYQGPAITIDSGGLEHILVLSAPSGGWGFIFDQARPAFERREVYITVVRPNPSVMHTMALVEQRMGTSVDVHMPISVFARVAAFGEDPSELPYSAAGRSGQ